MPKTKKVEAPVKKVAKKVAIKKVAKKAVKKVAAPKVTKPTRPVLSASLKAQIMERSATAFKRFDEKNQEHVTRCHRVTKDTLAYRLPAEARNVRGEGVVVTRKIVKGKSVITLTKKIVTDLVPVLGWPD